MKKKFDFSKLKKKMPKAPMAGKSDLAESLVKSQMGKKKNASRY